MPVTIKMMYVLVLWPVLLASAVFTLTIDSVLGTSVEDCFERVAIGEQIPSTAIYRNVSELTTKECEQICKQDKQCQTYDYGVGAKGNSTCDLSNISEKQIKEEKILLRHPDYDVYVRKFQCEQSPPTPIDQEVLENGLLNRPVIRPDEDKRPLADEFYERPYEPDRESAYTRPANERPDGYGNIAPDDRPPSYGDHKPQESIYKKPEPSYAHRPQETYRPRPDDRPIYGPRPEIDDRPPSYGAHKPQEAPYRPRPDRPSYERPEINDRPPSYGLHKPVEPPYIDRPPSYGAHRPQETPYRPEVLIDKPPSYGAHRPQEAPYFPKPNGSYYKPQNRPEDVYHSKPERPEYQYFIRPHRKPSYDRPLESKPQYSYGSQYASNYGSSQDHSIHVEIYDPPRYFKPSERPYHGYSQGSSGYGQGYGYYQSNVNQGSYYQENIGYGKPDVQISHGYGSTTFKPTYSETTHRPSSTYDSQHSGGYGNSQSSTSGYGSSQTSNYGGNSDSGYSQNSGSYSTQRPISGYGDTSNSYGSHSSDSGYSQSSGSSYSSQSSGSSYGSHSSGYGQSESGYSRPGSGYSEPSSGYGNANTDSSYGGSHHSNNGYGSHSTNEIPYKPRPSYNEYSQYNSYNQNSQSHSQSYDKYEVSKPSYDDNSLFGSHLGYGTHHLYEMYGYRRPYEKPTNVYNHDKPYRPKPGNNDPSGYGNPSYGESGYGNKPSGYGDTGYSKPSSDYGSKPANSYGSRPESSYGYDNKPTGYGHQEKPSGYGETTHQNKPSYTETGYGKPSYEDSGYQTPKPSYETTKLPTSYGETGYNKPTYDSKPIDSGYGKPPTAYDDSGYHGSKPSYQETEPDFNQTGYNPDRPDVKPVYEFEDKPNAPSYIFRPDGNVITTRPVVINDYEKPGYGRNPDSRFSYKACFRRVLAGRRALRGHVRRVVDCERLEDCMRECATEKRFHCESFNYRLDPSFRGKGLCELMTKPIEAFDLHRDFADDKNYDFYEIDRNSLEPNCPETLRGPGLLHSGFLSSKTKGQSQDRIDYGYKGVSRYDEKKYIQHKRYEDQFYVPYQIGVVRGDDRENWGQYGGYYGNYDSYYKNRNDFQNSYKHWRISDIDRHATYNKDFDYHTLGKHDYSYGTQYGDRNTIRGGISYQRRYGPSSFDSPKYSDFEIGHKHSDFEIDHKHSDFETDHRHSDFELGHKHSDFELGHKHFEIDRKHSDFEFDRPRPDFEIDHKHSDFESDHRHSDFEIDHKHSDFEHDVDKHSDFDHHIGKEYWDYLSWKRGKWNTSEGTWSRWDDRGRTEEWEGRSDDTVKDCSSRRRPGMSLGSGAVRRSLYAGTVVDCEAACFGEEEFKCVSYSYRYSSRPGADNCFLSERPYKGLEVSADSDSDVYAMPQHQGCHTITTKPWVESECFWHVRAGSSVSGTAVKAALTVTGLGACEAECIRAHKFFCRGFSFRFDPPTPGDDLENCILTSSPPTSLETGRGLHPSSGHELYARGNYGRGCEPALYDDVQHRETQCYLQYDNSARLTSSAVRGRARVADERACGAACTDAPFRCLSFSFRSNTPPGDENCLLSEIRLFDLQRGVDYEHSHDDLLFAFDLFNGQCWRKVYGTHEVPTVEIPHPLAPSIEDYPSKPEPSGPDYISGPSGPNYPSGPDKPLVPHKPIYEPPYIPNSGPSGPTGPDFVPIQPIPHRPHFKPSPEPYLPVHKPSYLPIDYKPVDSGYKPIDSGYKPIDSGYKPVNSGYKPIDSGYKPIDSGYKPVDSGYKPYYPPSKPYIPQSKPSYLPTYGVEKPSRPIGEEMISWRHYTVSGFPCRRGTSCAQNHIAGHWACEPEGGEIGSWDYCCAPTHRCGYSEGFRKPWCYVGPAEDQWRPCSEKYYPYHQHNVPHPSLGHREAIRPRPDRPTDKSDIGYLPEGDRKYWDDLYKNGPKAYYDRYGNSLPGYTRVPTESRPPVKYDRNPPRGSGAWTPAYDDEPQAAGFGAPRYWPVAYLHKSPPPNTTYFRFNESLPTTERNIRQTTNHPEFRTDKSIEIESRSLEENHRNEKGRNISQNDSELSTTTLKPETTTEITTTTTTEATTAFTTEREFKLNNTDLESPKADTIKEEDYVKGIDGKLRDFASIEVFNLEDLTSGNIKTLEAEEKQIEAIGRLLASNRGGKLVLDPKKDLEAKNIAIDKDFMDIGNKLPTRRGVVQRVSKEDLRKDVLNEGSLEVSETTFVRPPRVLSTTDNIRKAIINGKVYYDATIRDTKANSTRMGKSLRESKSIRRSVNPIRRVKRVYRKRYNPEEVRKRLLEREKSKSA